MFGRRPRPNTGLDAVERESVQTWTLLPQPLGHGQELVGQWALASIAHDP